MEKAVSTKAFINWMLGWQGLQYTLMLLGMACLKDNVATLIDSLSVAVVSNRIICETELFVIPRHTMLSIYIQLSMHY